MTSALSHMPTAHLDEVAPPCTADEARELVDNAVNHANGLLENVYEMIRRQAWIPLGYANIAELLKSPEIADHIVNPATGKAYSRQHLDRMGKAMQMLSSVAVAAGVDPADVSIDERRLRELKAAGIDDANESIVADLQRRREAQDDEALAPDEAQQIVDKHLYPQQADNNPEDSDAESNALPAESGSQLSAPSPRGERYEEPGEDDDEDADEPPASTTAAFDEAMEGTGSRAPQPAVTMEQAMAGAKAYVATTRSVTTIETLSEDLTSLLGSVESALRTARKSLDVFFEAGRAGSQLVEAEKKTTVLVESLSESERKQLAKRLSDASNMAATVELVSKIAADVADDADFAKVAKLATSLEASQVDAEQITDACQALAAALNGANDQGQVEEDLDSIMAELGL